MQADCCSVFLPALLTEFKCWQTTWSFRRRESCQPVQTWVCVSVPPEPLELPKEHTTAWGWFAYWLAPPPGVQSGTTWLYLCGEERSREAFRRGRTSRLENLKSSIFTSEHRETLDLLAQDLLQLSGVGVHVVVHLLRHLQQHLLILQPSDGLLRGRQDSCLFSKSVQLKSLFFGSTFRPGKRLCGLPGPAPPCPPGERRLHGRWTTGGTLPPPGDWMVWDKRELSWRVYW